MLCLLTFACELLDLLGLLFGGRLDKCLDLRLKLLVTTTSLDLGLLERTDTFADAINSRCSFQFLAKASFLAWSGIGWQRCLDTAAFSTPGPPLG